MMNKKKLCILLTVACLFCGAMAACGGNGETSETSSSVSEIAASVSLDKTEAEMDVHELLQLTATRSGTDETLVWTTSDASVATVENGLVKTLKQGVVTITATAGSASASCQITVVDSRTAPVLALEFEQIAIEKDEELTVNASVTYKGAPVIDEVALSWALAEGAAEGVISIEPSADTQSAVVRGLEYGETQLEISALVYGVPLLEIVNVKVCNTDVTFDVAGLDVAEGGYLARVALLETETDKPTLKPQITVRDKNIPVENAAIEWHSGDETIASVSADGTISAVSEGETVVTGTYENSNVKFFVSVYRPEVEAETKVTLETAGGGTVVLGEEIEGEVCEALLAGRNIFTAYDAETRTLTFDKTKLPTSVSDMGAAELVVRTEKAIFKVDAAVYTKVIRTAEDLDNMGALSKAAESEENLWGGYFVLGNDISYNKKFTPFISYATLEGNGIVWKGDSWSDGRSNGFKGVFDGQGYAIDGLEIECVAGGLFGVIHSEGVVRNVAFTNAVHWGWGGFICTAGDGRVENVYISAVQYGGSAIDCSGFIFSADCMGEARVVNCFIDITAVSGDEAYAIGSVHEGYGIYDGVYAVGNTNASRLISTGAGTRNVYGVYADYSELIAAGVDFGDWEGDFWTVVNGLPYPKKLSLPAFNVGTVRDGSIGRDTSVAIDIGRYDYIELDEAAINAGVVVQGNRIVIPADESVLGVSFRVFVGSVFAEEPALTLTYSVVDNMSVTTEGLMYVELGTDGDTFTLDLSAYADKISGKISSALFGTELFAASGEGTVVTLSKATLGKNYGTQTIVLTFEEKNGEITTRVTTVTVNAMVVTKVVRTAEDLDNMGALSKAAESEATLWGGYFVLGNNISYNKKFTSFISYAVLDGLGYGATWMNGRALGFKGVFDGQGYVIDGFQVECVEGGLFGVLHSEGVVKNVVFTNALHYGWGGFICSAGCGTVENVYISGTQYGSDSMNPSGFIFSKDCMGEARVINCFIDVEVVTWAGAEVAYGIGSAHLGYGILKNVYVVGTTVGINVLSSAGGGDVYGAYASKADMQAANIAVTAENGWDMSFWTVDENGLPLPKSLKI